MWLTDFLYNNRFSYPITQVTDEEIFWESTGNYLFIIDAEKVKESQRL